MLLDPHPTALPCHPPHLCRENNVEQVALDSLPSGAVSISVRGASIFGAAGAPAYALVINGNFT